MSKRGRKPSLEAAFRGLSSSVKTALSRETSSLRIGLAALALAADRCGVEYLSVEEIAHALQDAGVAIAPAVLPKAFSRAGNRITTRRMGDQTKYKVMVPGVHEVQSLIGAGNIEVVYVESGQPRSARKKLSEILSALQGVVRIADPYFGERTLDVLEAIPETCEVRFMTARISGNEARLKRSTADLKVERPQLEVRVFPNPAELHDRYVHSDAGLIIVGHGLKDVGGRESFVISVDRATAGDLIDTVRAAFDVKWGRSAAF